MPPQLPAPPAPPAIPAPPSISPPSGGLQLPGASAIVRFRPPVPPLLPPIPPIPPPLGGAAGALGRAGPVGALAAGAFAVGYGAGTLLNNFFTPPEPAYIPPRGAFDFGPPNPGGFVIGDRDIVINSNQNWNPVVGPYLTAYVPPLKLPLISKAGDPTFTTRASTSGPLVNFPGRGLEFLDLYGNSTISVLPNNTTGITFVSVPRPIKILNNGGTAAPTAPPPERTRPTPPPIPETPGPPLPGIPQGPPEILPFRRPSTPPSPTPDPPYEPQPEPAPAPPTNPQPPQPDPPSDPPPPPPEPEPAPQVPPPDPQPTPTPPPSPQTDPPVEPIRPTIRPAPVAPVEPAPNPNPSPPPIYSRSLLRRLRRHLAQIHHQYQQRHLLQHQQHRLLR